MRILSVRKKKFDCWLCKCTIFQFVFRVPHSADPIVLPETAICANAEKDKYLDNVIVRNRIPNQNMCCEML